MQAAQISTFLCFSATLTTEGSSLQVHLLCAFGGIFAGRVCCRQEYDIVVVSPRNYFLYTPLLPAVAVGTMEEHSVVEPVRNLVQGKVRMHALQQQINQCSLGLGSS